ncbi:recombinase family protein [Actinomycetospora sp. CA-053990]|uniref:recombinase family protein n=1 Tax=Actinomycetospora sp. CA-053990 TaxID=3239891 RepID=UPI003D92F6E9
MTRRAGCYLRISSDRTGEGLGVTRQREDTHALAERNGWTVLRDYVDNDVSASTGRRRPEYEAMLDDIRTGALEAVVVWDIDRLTRRPIEIEQFIELADDHGIALASVGGDVDIATDSGRLHLRIKGSVARSEVDSKSRRQKRQRQQSAEAGMRSGGPRPFGYSADGMHLHPDEAPVLADMYHQYLADQSLGGVATSLNKREITTPKGHAWTYASVKSVLANPRNAGLRGVRRLRPGKDGRSGLRERWHEIVGPAAWPGVVDEATFTAALNLLKGRHRAINTHPTNSTKYLLSGLALCGVCGRQVVTGNREGTRILRCPSLSHVSRRADRIEEFVTKVLLARLSRPDAIAAFAPPGKEPIDLTAIRTQQAALQTRLSEAAADYAELAIDRTAYHAIRGRIQEQLTELDRQLVQAGQVDPVAPLLGSERPDEVWADLSITAQRRILDRLMTVTVLPGSAGQPGGSRFNADTVRITWRES